MRPRALSAPAAPWPIHRKTRDPGHSGVTGMNAKTIVPLVVALVLGVVAAKLGRDMIAKRRAEEAKVKLIKVVMAADDVAPGSVITQEHLTLTSIPAEGSGAGISQYGFNKVSDVIGRVAMTQIVKGQPVLETLLAAKGSGGGAQAMIPEGMRAVTLEVNEYNGVAGLLLPGCQVDVVHTFKFKDDNGGDGGMRAQTLVENLRVLAVGRRTGVAPPSSGSKSHDDQLARSVTLLATQEQAELIDLAAHLGQPRLVLRNGLDKRVSGGKGVTLAELIKRLGRNSSGGDLIATLIANNPPATRPIVDPPPKADPVSSAGWRDVEVIRGGSSSTVRVSAVSKDKPGEAVGGTQDYDE
jgi:pilus assembly protein CpaB